MFPFHFPVLPFPLGGRKTDGTFPKTIIELIDDGREAIRPVIFKSKEILLDVIFPLNVLQGDARFFIT